VNCVINCKRQSAIFRPAEQFAVGFASVIFCSVDLMPHQKAQKQRSYDKFHFRNLIEIKLIVAPLLLCLLMWHQVDGAKNNGSKPNSKLLSWAKNGALALTINYAIHANANSNTIKCNRLPFYSP
jgi:hypothetical protein